MSDLSFNAEDFIETLLRDGKLSKIDRLKLKQYSEATPNADYVSIILASSLISEESLCSALADFVGGEAVLNIYGVSLSHDIYDIDISKAIKEEILPTIDENNTLVYLMTNPFNQRAIDLLNEWSDGKEFGISICTKALFAHIIEANSNILYGDTDGATDVKSHDEIRLLLEKTIVDAIRARASDIRMFSQGDSGTITFRIDGDLVKYRDIDLVTLTRLSEEVESPATTEVSDTNRDVPRTGILTTVIDKITYELRVNFIPTRNGIDTNLRFLYKDNFDITALGMEPDRLRIIEKFPVRESGLILFVGATGSGKSTTLYSLLDLVRAGNTICTVEDPVEHRLEGVAQVSVSKSVNFSDGIKAFLRHDPDIIVVGETRDQETAKHVIMASDTGHLTFSTLHTKTAVSAISRLRGLGLTGIEISDNLVAVVAQRLLKRVCTKCCTEVHTTVSQLRKELGLEPLDGVDCDITVHSEKGCSACNGKGTYGRCLGTELLLVDQEVRDMILNEESVMNMESRLVGKQLLSFEEDVCSHVMSGVVSVEEARRVLVGVRRV